MDVLTLNWYSFYVGYQQIYVMYLVFLNNEKIINPYDNDESTFNETEGIIKILS